MSAFDPKRTLGRARAYIDRGETPQAAQRWIEMPKQARNLAWPNWSTWALLAVVLTSILTVAATINDIW